MKRILVAALTHNDKPRLLRLIRSIEAQQGFFFEYDLKIIVNTLDPEYADTIKNAIPYEVIETESNGMPGKGKNSVINLFSSRKEYDYCILMDGDDCLYPCAFEQIGVMLSQNPDIIGLQTNDAVENVSRNNLKIQTGPNQWLYSWFDKMENWHSHAGFIEKTKRDKDLGQQTTPDRILLISRRVLDFNLRCSERLPVYEDYVLSLHAQYLYKNYGLRYFHTSTTYVYLYDKNKHPVDL
jgi:glycosyltransferase involved in cell wall biosynthesis